MPLPVRDVIGVGEAVYCVVRRGCSCDPLSAVLLRCGVALPPEYVFVIIVQLMSSVFVAVLVSNVMNVVAQRTRRNKIRQVRLDGIQALLLQFDVPKDMRRQLRKWAVRVRWPALCVCPSLSLSPLPLPLSPLPND